MGANVLSVPLDVGSLDVGSLDVGSLGVGSLDVGSLGVGSLDVGSYWSCRSVLYVRIVRLGIEGLRCVGLSRLWSVNI